MPVVRKPSPRAEYRLVQAEQIQNSASLALKYPKLRALKVDLTYLDMTGTTRNGGMRYKANLDHAKSRFCFNCMYTDCVGGDFDLTRELAQAVSRKQKVVEGEMRCEGVRHNRERKTQLPCQAILQYKLSLGY